MKIYIKLAFLLLIFILLCAGCGKITMKTTEYMMVFHDILTENMTQLDEVDYISIFIENNQLSTHELKNIQ